MFEVLLSTAAQRFYEKADVTLTRRLNRCFAQLQHDPFTHPNIKRLSGKLTGYYRYRVGDWRVVYEIRADRAVVIILLIAHRREVYR
jgi:mRNA interferase RelE/StbE